MIVHEGNLDKMQAKSVVKAIEADCVGCAIQDVRSVFDPDEALYGECLARLFAPDGRVLTAGEFLPDVDASREMPELDRHMLKIVLNLLEADPLAVLGCNISADNLENRHTWSPILNQIRQRSHLAHRLVLELTEGREISCMSFCVDAIAEVQKVGCRVALDDFGVGFSTPRLLQLINFDIVKIDKAFLHDIRSSIDGRNSLQNIVDLASSFVPIIVVEGVETAWHADAIRITGATHIQGHFFSRPLVYKPVTSDSTLSTSPATGFSSGCD
ncbi:EAL domain-containing protein [Agrobacterium radiobacter]|uniref:EAL domain-containing protein n=1 Tax=Agrobacterium radiobacter TaxID=362 RepID=UPI000DDA90FD